MKSFKNISPWLKTAVTIIAVGLVGCSDREHVSPEDISLIQSNPAVQEYVVEYLQNINYGAFKDIHDFETFQTDLHAAQEILRKKSSKNLFKDAILDGGELTILKNTLWNYAHSWHEIAHAVKTEKYSDFRMYANAVHDLAGDYLVTKQAIKALHEAGIDILPLYYEVINAQNVLEDHTTYLRSLAQETQERNTLSDEEITNFRNMSKNAYSKLTHIGAMLNRYRDGKL